MCFSAGASFGAGALIISTGIIAIKKTDSPKKIAFACIPIFFGLQQLSEGILWLTFKDPELIYWQKPSILFFIFIGKVFWQVFIPVAIWQMETDKFRKKLIYYLIWMGMLSAIHILYCIFAYDVSALNEARHIKYHLTITHWYLHQTFYVLPIALPFFISSFKFMKLLGITLLVSLILSLIFYYYHILSVWCFFAAILSLQVVFIISKNKNTFDRY